MEGVAATGADAPGVALGGARALGSVTGLAGAHSFSVHARLIARFPEKANGSNYRCIEILGVECHRTQNRNPLGSGK